MEVGGSKPLAPTIPGREGRTRRLIPLLFVVVVVLLIAWGSWSAVTVFAAAQDANDGRVAIERAEDRFQPGDIVEGRPLADLGAARASFRRAHDRLRSPFLTPARIIPILGRQIRSADALTGAAAGIAGIAIDAIQEGREILGAPRATGGQRVALLRRMATLADDAERRIANERLGPISGLIGPLATARREFGAEISTLRRTLRRAAAGAAAGADLLQGPRRTLVFAANNAEMRAGSGMFLSVGELTTVGGRIDLGRMESVGPVTIPKGVLVSGDLAARWGWANPSRDWTSLMLSPDFEVNASLATRMWKAARGRSVDGVVAIDPVGLRALLQATGPVKVGGRTINAWNVIQELLHDHYRRFPGVLSAAPRDEFLGDIAAAVMARLDTGRWDTAALMSGLADATRGRHVMVWSARASEQAVWRAARTHGRLSGSSLMVSLLNRGGNKLDWFMRTEADLSFVPTAQGSEGVLKITVRNTTPEEGEPRYVQGPHPDTGGKAGEYLGILAVTLPGASGGGRIDGVENLGVVGPDGPTRVVGAYFRLARGRTRTFVVRFDLSVSAGAVRVEPSARVPATQWRFGSARWTDEAPRLVRWKVEE